MPSLRNRSERIGTPSLGQIAEWWSAPSRQADVEELFPDLVAWWIGWGEPFCFACGWRAPVLDGQRAWFELATNSWLERAHLADFCFGGPNDSSNIVPLCHLCHDAMPSFTDRGVAAIWVRDHKSTLMQPHLWQAWTDAFAAPDRSGRSRQARIFRLKAEYYEVLNQLKDVPADELGGALLHVIVAIDRERRDFRAILAAARTSTKGAPK